MSQLQVEIVAGSEAGRRVALRPGGAVTFGRAGTNTLVIDLPFISREHGELRWVPSGKDPASGTWMLTNRSPHGVYLDKKRVTRKPRAVEPPATILIGEEPVLRVLAEVDTGGATERPSNQAAEGKRLPGGEGRSAGGGDAPAGVEPQAGLSGRAKVWIGIGVYLALMLGAFLFFSLNRGGGESGPSGMPPALTPQQIAESIRTPLPKQPPSPRLVLEALAKAEQHRRVDDERQQVLALREYQQALAMTRGPVLERAIEQRRFQDVQDRVVQQVQRRYADALADSQANAWESAYPAFRDLYEYYDDYDSIIYRNAQKHAAFASRQLGDRRR